MLVYQRVCEYQFDFMKMGRPKSVNICPFQLRCWGLRSTVFLYEQHITGWWFQSFSIIYGIILPIDFHIFQGCKNHQPDNISYPQLTSSNLVDDGQIPIPEQNRCWVSLKLDYPLPSSGSS